MSNCVSGALVARVGVDVIAAGDFDGDDDKVDDDVGGDMGDVGDGATTLTGVTVTGSTVGSRVRLVQPANIRIATSRQILFA